MKAMGYEGVDVRGLKGLDNVSFGSVIYDLKGEDLARKKEIGTAKYSVSAETDTNYMSAVERGDTKTAQLMVGEAAKNAGYDIKAYHGTGYDFTVFDKSKQGDNYQDWGRLGKGFYFAPTAREAETWAEHSRGVKNNVMSVYLRSENMLDSFEALPDDLKDTIPAEWEGLTRRLAEKYVYNYVEYMQEFGYDVQKILKEKGYDGINGHVEFVVFDPEQIKSADAITHDDKGNIIPLSERFNTAHEDIRFSLSEETNTEYVSAIAKGDMETAQSIVEKAAESSGYNIRAYHGTARADRVGNVFLPERATSGPMAFFTNDKQVAENYSKSKPDTSMAYDPDYDSYETQFRIKRGKLDLPLYRAWNYLPYDARQRITQKASQLREDWDGDYDLILDPETNEANGGFQWQLKEARGNALKALTEQWLNSGTLFNDEGRFLDVLKMAGVNEEFEKIGMDNLYFKDPNAKHEKVYDTFLRITNPFDTANVNEEFIAGLESWYDAQDQSNYEVESQHADLWDKNNRDAYDFANVLRDDLANNTTHAWTSIPDSVTDYLKSKGYDGIKDTGGKYSGESHIVYIPFSSEQIKSAEPVTYDDNGKVIPLNERFNPDKVDIRNSLSQKGDRGSRTGNYNTPLNDLYYEGVAPVNVANDTNVGRKAETVAPVVEDYATTADSLEAQFDQAEATLLDIINEAKELAQGYAEQRYTDEEYENKYSDIMSRHSVATEKYDSLLKEVTKVDKERLASLSDADAPPELEAPYYGETGHITPADPFDKRDMIEVGNRKVKAYMYENPEVKQFFQDEARGMLYDLENSVNGERFQREDGSWVGVKRHTTADIAELRDVWHYTKDQIKAGLNAIIEDNGKENNAVSKRIEFMLDNRLRNGYETVDGYSIPANQEYLNLMKEKGIEDYYSESFDNLVQHADEYMPLEDDIAPMTSESIDNVVQNADEYVPLEDDIAPMTEEEANALQDEKVAAHSATSLEAIQTELENVKELRKNAFANFEQKIASKQAELKSKKNKDTKVANNLRMQIERLKRLRDSTDADYSKRIGTLETREKLVREGKPTTRQEHHNNIINDMKATFSSGGFDFDDVLSKAKNLSTFSTVDNTPQRVMEKALGYKEGQILSDLTVNKVAQNETKGIKWLNSFTDRKNGLLAQISKQYNIKPGSKESAAAQMYAEGFYVNDNNDVVEYGDAELAQDFPNISVRNNIKWLAQDPRIRQIYDATLSAINESRTRNAYPEIPRLDNYFLHFRAMEDTFSRLGLPFNPNDIRAKDLPTDLNGVTADLKPGQPYFASAMHRKGKRTSFDLLGGLERYLTSAKNQIYHIDDIQTLRALRNYIADTYGQANGLESLDTLTEEEAQERIEKVYNSHLSTFAKFLNEEANVLAGKTTLIDRGLEGIIGRRGITFLDTVNKQVGSNMVGFNVSSSLTNFLPVAQTFAKTNKFDFTKAFAQTVSNKFGSLFGKGDSFAEDSPVIIRRKGADRFYRTPFQKAGDAGYVLMSAVDNISTELIARTKYNELTRKGMDSQQAHFETDKWVSRLMGDRSLGQQPQLYNSKMLGIFTKFQLEVRNQLDSQFYDTIQEAKVANEDIENALARNAKTAAKVTSTFVQLAVVQHLFGKAFESIAGYNPAFDIISVLATMFGFDDDEESEDTVLDNVEQGFLELLEDLPYTSTFTGGRIPISSALPVEQVVTGKDDYGNEKPRLETIAEAAPYYVLPTGYGQIKKTTAGLKMFSDEHPVAGSYTDSGNLRFPVEDTPINRIQAGVFGQYASENAREYFDNDYAPLKEKQIQEYIDVDIPIKDYWAYREELAKQETLEDKFDYIAGLDLPVEKKNILINNIVDRKEAVDLEGYEDFSGYEEFDFATKNPEKYDFLQSNNISYDVYNASEESRKAYNWASKNPEGYAVSKAVSSDVVTYRQYASELYDIKADKDENGKSISGSRKEKVVDYINNLDADYGAKIILFKSEYPSDDTYNEDIVNYVNNLESLSYEERITIFTELGFVVSGDTVYWD